MNESKFTDLQRDILRGREEMTWVPTHCLIHPNHLKDIILEVGGSYDTEDGINHLTCQGTALVPTEFVRNGEIKLLSQ